MSDSESTELPAVQEGLDRLVREGKVLRGREEDPTYWPADFWQRCLDGDPTCIEKALSYLEQLQVALGLREER